MTFLTQFNKETSQNHQHNQLKKLLTIDKWRINEHLEKHISNIFKQFNNQSITIIEKLSDDNYTISMGPDDEVPPFFGTEINKRDFTQATDSYNIFCKFFTVDEFQCFHKFNNLTEVSRFQKASTINLILPIDVFISSKFLEDYIYMYAMYETAQPSYALSHTFSIKKMLEQKQIKIFILDNGRSKLLKNPESRGLFDVGWYDYPNILPNANHFYNTIRQHYFTESQIMETNRFPFTPLVNNFFPLEIDFLWQGLQFENKRSFPAKAGKPWKTIKKLLAQNVDKMLSIEQHQELVQKIIK